MILVNVMRPIGIMLIKSDEPNGLDESMSGCPRNCVEQQAPISSILSDNFCSLILL